MVKNLPNNAGDMVQSLVWEDPTCRRATKRHVPPLRKLLEPALESQGSATGEAATMRSPRMATREKPGQQRKTQHTKNKSFYFFKTIAISRKEAAGWEKTFANYLFD